MKIFPPQESIEERALRLGIDPGLITPDDEELEQVTKLQERFQKMHNARIEWQHRWETNTLILNGYHTIARNTETGEVRIFYRKNNRRATSTDNEVVKVHHAIVGKLTRTLPSWATVPGSNDLNDRRASEINDTLLEYHYKKRKIVISQLLGSADISRYGTTIWKVCWDKNGGKEIAQCPDCGFQFRNEEADAGQPCPHCSMEQEMSSPEGTTGMSMPGGQEMMLAPGMETKEPPMLEAKREGEVRAETIDIFDFFVDSGATCIEDSEMVCHRQAVSLEKLRRDFSGNQIVQLINPDKDVSTDSRTHGVNGERMTRQLLENHVWRYEFHMQPNDDHPQGLVIVMAGGRILEVSPSPYYELFEGHHPFWPQYWRKDRETFWGNDWINQAWPSQKEKNMTLTQMRENRELMNTPRLFTFGDSGITNDEIDQRAGRVIKLTQTARKPEWMDVPSFPTYVYQELARFDASIRGHGLVSDHEAGVTGSEQSGRYAAILQAQSDQQVGPILKFNTPSFEAVGQAISALCHKYYDDDRVWTINGTDGPRTYAFKDAAQANGNDIVVQEQDGLSSNKAVRQQEVREWVAAGLYTDPRTGMPNMKAVAKDAGLKLHWLGGETDSDEHVTASAIPDLVKHGGGVDPATGQPLPPWTPKPWDDADIFSEELLTWLRGPGRNEDQAVVQQVAQIWMYYYQRSSAFLQMQQAAQPQAPGQPPGQPTQGGGGQQPPSAGLNSNAESEANVQSADQSGETQARTTSQHEG